MNKLHILLFLTILALGTFLRFYKITTVPPSLSHDEVAIAYNAYSILETGKDEYGAVFPLLFRSFDDYKLPGMVYSTIPAIALFGKTESAARLPSAVFGVLSIVVLYKLSKELSGKDKWIALPPMLMLAISPWHINFSRQLFESNGAVFWFMLGTYFLLRSRRNFKEIIWAGLFYVLSLYFYYSVRLVIPFVILLYAFAHWKTIKEQWKTTVFAISICVVFFLPLGREMFSSGGMERISIVSVVNDPAYTKKKDEFVNQLGTNPTFIERILYNRRIALLHTVLQNYAKNISPDNLFVRGTGTYGALHLWDALLIPLGLHFLLKLSPFSSLLLCVWLLSSFLPGALSINQPNTLRTLIAAPPFAILSGFGIFSAIQYIQKRRIERVYLFYFGILLLTLAINIFMKFHYAYFVDNPSNNSVAFGDGNKQMIGYVATHKNNYDRIYISGYYWRPYIFLLYWSNVDPKSYQKSGTREAFDRFVFTAASWDTNGIKLMDPSFDPSSLENQGKVLFILSPQEYELHSKHFKKIEDINGRRKNTIFIAAVEQ